jgi:hypothetical protein
MRRGTIQNEFVPAAGLINALGQRFTAQGI